MRWNQLNSLLQFIFMASVIFYVEDCWVDSVFSSGIIPWTLAIEKRVCLRDGDGVVRMLYCQMCWVIFTESLALEWFWEIYSLLELDFAAKLEQHIQNNNGLNERSFNSLFHKVLEMDSRADVAVSKWCYQDTQLLSAGLSLSLLISVLMGRNGCWGSGAPSCLPSVCTTL